MNAPFALTRMTVERFLEWVDARRASMPHDEPKWELFDGIPQMQEHEAWAHNRIKMNLGLALMQAFSSDSLPFQAAIDGIGVRIGPSESYQPDVVVFPAGLIADTDRTAPAPVIVAEVLSPSSVHTDLKIKAEGYARVPTILHYLVLDPIAENLHHFRRQGDRLVAPDVPINGLIHLDPPGIVLDTAVAFAR